MTSRGLPTPHLTARFYQLAGETPHIALDIAATHTYRQLNDLQRHQVRTWARRQLRTQRRAA